MATEVLMPALSPTMEEGTLLRCSRKPDDARVSTGIPNEDGGSILIQTPAAPVPDWKRWAAIHTGRGTIP